MKSVISNRWHKSANQLPPVNDEFGESDYVLCLEPSGYPFTGWYSSKLGEWYNNDRDTPMISRRVVWWRPMIKLPKGY